MRVISDLHIHSKYSRAVSQEMTLPKIGEWARAKGIDLVGTSDFTHPLWVREAKATLEEVEEGVYRVKGTKAPYFLFSTEISSIYSQGEKTRRIHNLIFAPNIETVEKINEQLSGRGVNLMSDGRPICGLSARELTELILSVNKDCLVIPSHAWTPWFSLYGSVSGFDSLEECFGKMAPYIYAIETGLSSSPAMNWRIKELDNRSIISFSDAHSPSKLGREATIFEIPENEEISYKAVVEAIKGKGEAKIASTIEFYPEEGKYHFTGHRNCNVRHSPEETKKLGAVCPVCGRRLTVGVMHRVDELASREIKDEELKIENDELGIRWIGRKGRSPYVMMVPLLEILAQVFGVKTAGQNILNEYKKLTENFGGEFNVLLSAKTEEIAKISGPKIAEGLAKVRSGEIVVEPGFDGVFGTVKIWPLVDARGEPQKEEEQMSLF